MGCFDTFEGKVKCKHCGKEFTVSEQTKDYDCLMSYFRLGDYIYDYTNGCDDSQGSFIEKCEGYCKHCKTAQQVNIAVKNWQVIGFLNEEEFKTFNLNTSNNIREGLWRILEHKEICKVMFGYDDNYSFRKEGYRVGEIIEDILNCDWVVDEVYKEVLDPTCFSNVKHEAFLKATYKDNWVYVVHKKGDSNIKRIIITFENVLSTYVRDYNFDDCMSRNYSYDDEAKFNREYRVKASCKLQKY